MARAPMPTAMPTIFQAMSFVHSTRWARDPEEAEDEDQQFNLGRERRIRIDFAREREPGETGDEAEEAQEEAAKTDQDAVILAVQGAGNPPKIDGAHA